MLFSGYLTATEVLVNDLGRMRARLRVPNRELLGALAGLVESWIKTQVGGATELSRMLTALLGGDAGASPIHALAVVFDGKRAWVRAAP
ncbi:lipase chaperone [Chondromyces apiculatus]|uniref:Uncharacterized protein n=1 Tax=Chondromyces apiculatus DSM 436 TaxID=1192034 RepID=A0A017T006_9BACT|nr:lipase chaperone [Chondromyces apiculatus]EYF02544.1 Hypothetical protein CAP_6751 [Chondromyces apiculatus DSM 436]